MKEIKKQKKKKKESRLNQDHSKETVLGSSKGACRSMVVKASPGGFSSPVLAVRR